MALLKDLSSNNGTNDLSIDSYLFYGTNIAQLLLGLIIAICNALILGAVFTKQHLKTSTNLLLANICFANCVVGIMLCIVNVMDGWTQVVLLKTETSLVIINSYINIASFLALITNKYVVMHSPTYKMGKGSCGRIILALWIVVLLLSFIKAMIFGFSQMGYRYACFRCFQVFEVVTLVIFTVSTVAGYVITGCAAAAHRRQTVHDSHQPTHINYGAEFDMIMGVGLFLIVFICCFVFFVVMYMTWLGSGTILRGADEILVTLYFAHCVINPILIGYVNKDLGKVVRRMMSCGMAGDDTNIDQDSMNMPPGNGDAVAARLNGTNGSEVLNRFQSPEPTAPPASGRSVLESREVRNPATHPSSGSQGSANFHVYDGSPERKLHDHNQPHDQNSGPRELAPEQLPHVEAPPPHDASYNLASHAPRNPGSHESGNPTNMKSSSLPAIQRGKSALINSGFHVDGEKVNGHVPANTNESTATFAHPV